MIFGAMLIGMGTGLIAMVIAIAIGTGALFALLAYCLASCVGTVGICVIKVLHCKADMPPRTPLV